MQIYRRGWNRKKVEIERTIAFLKEKSPSLTVREAQKILVMNGINLSIKGIWSIWKRYGYAGFLKKDMTNNFTTYCVWTAESKSKFEKAKKIMNSGQIKKAAQILNSLPSLPHNDVIQQIPDEYLNIKRQVEKMGIMFGKMPFSEYIEKVGKLFKTCLAQGLNYSALRVGTMRLIAITWSARPKEQLELIKILKRLIIRIKGHQSPLLFEPRFTIHICEGITYSMIPNIPKAYNCTLICKRLLESKKHQSGYLTSHLAFRYTYIQNYKEAERYFLKAINKVDNQTKKRLLGAMAHTYLNQGEYTKAIKLSRYIKFTGWNDTQWDSYYQACFNLIKGKPQEAIIQANLALTSFNEDRLLLKICSTYLVIVSALMSMGHTNDAQRIIRGFIPVLKKNKLQAETIIFENLISDSQKIKSQSYSDELPTVRLILLLRNHRYYSALKYAKKQGIMDYFYKFCLCFSENIIKLVEVGKPTNLPKAILRLPVFNKESPVYHIKLLGGLVVLKNQEYVKTKLKPKDAAFLIYLCQKATEPKKFVNLDEVYANFWPKSEKASRNFSHLLVRLKKALKIPPYLFEISRAIGNPILSNQGIYFTTDYQEFEQNLARAKALERAGEWGFAKKEYLRAFKLFL